MRHNKIKEFEDITRVDLALQLSFLYLTDSIGLRIDTINSVHILSLDLSRNELPKIPKINNRAFRINLCNNNITTVKNDSFNNFRSLIDLNLSFNQIKTIELDAFSGLFFIKQIDLSFNKLEYLNPHLFSKTYIIFPLNLNLSNNLIKVIDGSLLQNLKSLVELNLSFNSIDSIHDDSFINLRFLKTLFLNDNNYIPLTNRTLLGLKSIKNIYLSSNLFLSQSNIMSIIKSLQLNQKRAIYPIIYYDAIYMISVGNFSYTRELCDLTLFFIKHNLHLNLRTADDITRFLEDCLV